MVDNDYDLRFIDKEVPEYRSSVNYAGVHPWETRTVVLLTNNAWFFPRHHVTKWVSCATKGQWKRNQLSSLPRRDQVRYRMEWIYTIHHVIF